MKVTVYHANSHETRFECIPRTWTSNRDDYKKVAEVETEDINNVFELTQHIDEDWTKNPGVTPIGNEHRSTSIGDVYVLEDGSAKMIGPSGLVDC